MSIGVIPRTPQTARGEMHVMRPRGVIDVVIAAVTVMLRRRHERRAASEQHEQQPQHAVAAARSQSAH